MRTQNYIQISNELNLCFTWWKYESRHLVLFIISAPNSQMPMPPHPNLPPQNSQPAYQQPIGAGPVAGNTFCINLIFWPTDVHSVEYVNEAKSLISKQIFIWSFSGAHNQPNYSQPPQPPQSQVQNNAGESTFHRQLFIVHKVKK